MPKLYHFTGAEPVAGIQRRGISDGGALLGDFVHFARPAQWLTDDPEWRQDWATRETIHCDRTEARFLVHIPDTLTADLKHWPDVAERMGFDAEGYAEFNRQGGNQHEHWWIYFGAIPRQWLKGLVYRPGFILRAA